MKLFSKKAVGLRDVVDITVEDNHTFLAEGLVTHNSGARKFCLQAQPNNIEDLSAITAIYRPGPLKANVHNMYVDAGKDIASIKYDHPLIEKVLGPTRGFIVFQEQFMNLAIELAGFTPGESDQMRKTLVKKSLDTLDKKSGEKAMLREKFVKGAKELHGIDEKITNDLFDKIEFFSLYGFNKSLSGETQINIYDEKGQFLVQKLLKDVKKGEWVLSRDEKTGETIQVQVANLHNHGEQELVRVTLDSGKTIECTLDHKFRVKDTNEMLPLWQILQANLSVEVILLMRECIMQLVCTNMDFRKYCDINESSVTNFGYAITQ